MLARAIDAEAGWLEGCHCQGTVLKTTKGYEKRRSQMLDQIGCRQCWAEGWRGADMVLGRVATILQHKSEASSSKYRKLLAKAPTNIRAIVVYLEEHIKSSLLAELRE